MKGPHGEGDFSRGERRLSSPINKADESGASLPTNRLVSSITHKFHYQFSEFHSILNVNSANGYVFWQSLKNNFDEVKFFILLQFLERMV